MAEKLTKFLDGELRKNFPKVHTSEGCAIFFEGPRFPNLRIWNLSDPISTGKIEIKQSLSVSLVSYEINMSKYIFGSIVSFILAVIFMFLFNFPIGLITIFAIAIMFSTIIIPSLAIMSFGAFVRKAIEKTDGSIIAGV